MNKKTNCVEKICWLKFCSLETKTNMRCGVGWGCSLPLSQSLPQPGGGSTTISVVKMRSCFKMSGDIPPCLEFSSWCSYSTHSHSTRESYYGWTRLGFIFCKCRIVVCSVLERMKNWQETRIFILLCSGITAGRSTNLVQQFSDSEIN